MHCHMYQHMYCKYILPSVIYFVSTVMVVLFSLLTEILKNNCKAPLCVVK